MKFNLLLYLALLPIATSCSPDGPIASSIEGKSILSIECTIHSSRPTYNFDQQSGELFDYNTQSQKYIPLKTRVIGTTPDYKILKSYSSKLIEDDLTVKTYIYFDNNPIKKYDLTIERINLKSLRVSWFHQHGNEEFQGTSKCSWSKGLNKIQDHEHHNH